MKIETLYEQLRRQDRAEINEPDGEYRNYRVVGILARYIREPEDFEKLVEFVNTRPELTELWKEWVLNHQIEVEWGLLPDWLLSGKGSV